jgi:ketosteroid isomerase-like protein
VEEARSDAGLTWQEQLIREFNQALERGDLAAGTATMHPDAVWEHNLGAGSPEEGVYRGRESLDVREGMLVKGRMNMGALHV